ncbi:hypothetical protein PVK06_018070 [Gossypium arboreum]|uniref:Uncharacterized protein n=1 Tax=Gossypium arboreum TaxID=29729 RepID=A0ABR0Q4U9_GOSAR|nr:hypothetical protein PVK06_018070 [Gossypium arboreum]
MVSAKKLIKLVRKWEKMAAIRRKRITPSSATSDTGANSCNTSTTVEQGDFVVYSIDQKHFVLPLEYLKNEIVMELFNLAEEKPGLSGNKALICMRCSGVAVSDNSKFISGCSSQSGTTLFSTIEVEGLSDEVSLSKLLDKSESPIFSS